MKTLGQLQSEVAAPTRECPLPQRWKCYDAMATEYEVLLFLMALVRMLKPALCVETGTYLGHGAYHIGYALRENENGVLWSAEPDPVNRRSAEDLLRTTNLMPGWVALHAGTGQAMIEQLTQLASIDFAFLDSNIDTRMGELRALLPRLTPGAVVAVHDTSTYHDARNGGLRTALLRTAADAGLQVINFDTPRGLMLLRKVP